MEVNKELIPHPHAALIKAWADGAVIQVYDTEHGWRNVLYPKWELCSKYRIRPGQPEDLHKWAVAFNETNVVSTCTATIDSAIDHLLSNDGNTILKYTWDGVTRQFKGVEVIPVADEEAAEALRQSHNIPSQI